MRRPRLGWAVGFALGGCGERAPEPAPPAAVVRARVETVSPRPGGFVDWMTTVPDAALVAPSSGSRTPGGSPEEATIRSADLDGDGRQEVVLSVGSSFRRDVAAAPRVFRLNAKGDALEEDAALTRTLGRHRHIAGIIDLDGDGRWDVVQPTPAPMVTFDALAEPPWATWSMPTSIKQGEPLFEGTLGMLSRADRAGIDLVWPEPTCTGGLSVLRAGPGRIWTPDPEAFDALQPAVRLDGVFSWRGRLQAVGMACEGAPALAYGDARGRWTPVADGFGQEPPLSSQGVVAMSAGVDARGDWDTWWIVAEHRVRILARDGMGWRDTLDPAVGASPARVGCNAMFQGGVPLDLDGDGRLDFVAAQGDDHTSGCAGAGVELGLSAWRRTPTGGWQDVADELGLGDGVNAVSLYADDVDGDGDGDLLVSGMGHLPSLYRNDSSVPSLGVRVVDGPGMRPAVGAWLVAETEGLASQARAVGVVTVRNATITPWVGVTAPSGRVSRLVVHFADGRTATLRDVAAGQTLVVRPPSP